MLPSLSPLSSDVPACVAVPPPPFFKPIVGAISDVKIDHSHYRPDIGNSSSKRAGLRYEGKVQVLLMKRDAMYGAAPAVNYTDATGRRVCFPDGLWLLPDRHLIVEIKLTHMPEAWWQLRRKYEPLIRVWNRGEVPVQVLEIVSEFDPATPFPELPKLFPSLDALLSQPPSSHFGVLKWKL